MTVTTTMQLESGFEIKLDEKLVFRVAKLPESFAFQPSEFTIFFISREPRDFLNRTTYLLAGADRTEIAKITGEYMGSPIFGSKLTVGENDFEIRLEGKEFLDLAFNCQNYLVEGLGIKMETKRSKINLKNYLFEPQFVSTTVEDPYETELAIVALLHFTRIWKWREQSRG